MKREEPSLRFRTELPDAVAIRAVAAGLADAAQQQRAFQAILLRLCECRRLSYVPGQQDITAFLQGRVSVGLEMEQYALQSVDELKQLFDRRKVREPK